MTRKAANGCWPKARTPPHLPNWHSWQAYLAARMVCGELSRKEIVFLSQLADAFGLEAQFVEQLEQQAGF